MTPLLIEREGNSSSRDHAPASGFALEGQRPIAVDLFSGLGGWTEGLVAAGWHVIRFDIEDMCKLLGEPYPEHFSLVIQDVLT